MSLHDPHDAAIPHGDRAHARSDARLFGAAVLTVSTSAARGERDDLTGPAIVERLGVWGFAVHEHRTVSDDREAIAASLREWADGDDVDVVLTTGGTGLAPGDVTPEATADVLDRRTPGIAESLRRAGQRSTPLAALSRGEAGLRDRTLIVNLPGSPGGVRDGLDDLEAVIVHAVEIATAR